MVDRVKIIKKSNTVQIYIDDMLHLSFKIKTLVGFKSWVGDKYFKIRFYFKDSINITAKYDNRDLWKSILFNLNKS